MDAIIRRPLKKGLRTYHRYTIANDVRYDYPTKWEYGGTQVRKLTDLITVSASYEKITNGWTYGDPYYNYRVENYIDYSTWNRYPYTINLTSAGGYYSSEVYKIYDGYFEMGNAILVYQKMEMIRTVIGQKRGSYVDTIMTVENFPENGISGNYWYERIL